MSDNIEHVELDFSNDREDGEVYVEINPLTGDGVINYPIPSLHDYTGVMRMSTHRLTIPGSSAGSLNGGEEEEEEEDGEDGELEECSYDTLRDDYPNNILWKEDGENDPLSRFLQSMKGDRHNRKLQELYLEHEDSFFKQFGICCHERVEIDSILQNFFRSYRPLDLSFFESPKYEAPIWEKNDEVSAIKVCDLCLSLIFLQSESGSMSNNDVTRVLKLLKALFEIDRKKVNFCVTWKSMTNGLDEELEKRKIKIVFCISCKKKIHLFLDHLIPSLNEWKFENLPVCPHCYGLPIPTLRKQNSPYFLKKGNLVPKPRHYLIFTPFSFIFNDILSNDESLIGKLEPEEVLKDSGLSEKMKKEMGEQINSLGRQGPRIVCLYDVNQDDVSSRNNSSTAIKVGIQSVDFPFLEDRKHFDKIITQIVSEGHGKKQEGWVVKVLCMYLLNELAKYSWNPGYYLTCKTSNFNPIDQEEWNGDENLWSNNSNLPQQNIMPLAPGEKLVHIKYALRKTKFDKVDHSDSLGFKRTSCSSCRRVVKDIDPKKWGVCSGCTRSLLSVLSSKNFDDERYKRGIKRIAPLVELYKSFGYDYLEQNAEDCLHKIINMFDNIKDELGDSQSRFKVFLQSHVWEFVGSFRGIKRLNPPITKMGNYTYESKKNFITFFVPVLLFGGNDDIEKNINTISVFIILSEALRMLYSNCFNFRKWSNLYDLLVKYKILADDEKKVQHCYHKFFSHLLNGINDLRKHPLDDVLVFDDLLINLLEENSTLLAEEYYALPRRRIKKGSNFADNLDKQLKRKNLSKFLVDSKGSENVKEIVRRINMKAKDKIFSNIGGEYNGYELYWRGRKAVDPKRLFLKWPDNLISILQYLSTCELETDDQEKINTLIMFLKNELITPELKCEEIRSMNIQIFEYSALKIPNYEFEFTSKNTERDYTSSTKGGLYNKNIRYQYPTESGTDEEGNTQVNENDAFWEVGSILHIFEIWFSGGKYHVVVVNQNKRLGFWIPSPYLSDEIFEMVKDIQIVEQVGSSVKTIDIRFIMRHVFLVKFMEDVMETPSDDRPSYELYVFSSGSGNPTVGDIDDGRSRTTFSVPFSIVIELPHERV